MWRLEKMKWKTHIIVSVAAAYIAIVTQVFADNTTTTTDTNSSNDTTPCFCLKKVTDQLFNPVAYVTIRRGDSQLFLVVEQRGVVRAFRQEDGQERALVFLNITDRVQTSHAEGDERGLLSIALHPDYAKGERGRVFAYYIARVSEEDYAYVTQFTAINDVVDVTSEQILLRIKQPAARANGGQLLFADDGFLYVFTGDGSGHDAKPSGHAQDLHSLLGKSLRLDVNQQGFEPGDSGCARLYAAPANNLFSSHPQARPEVFALGFRNPWRCSQDSKARGGLGDIFCGDTGKDLYEEINQVRRGRNYGWPLKEGNHCFNEAKCSNIENEMAPVFTYQDSQDYGSAVVGGYVYRGAQFSSLVGHYVYGDAVTGETFLLEAGRHGGWTSERWPLCPTSRCPCDARHSKLSFLLAFGLHSDGELMLLMTSKFSTLEPKGTLLRATPPTGTSKKAVTCGTCRTTTARVMLTAVLAVFTSILYIG